jgi:hypothetical protein
MYHHLPDPHPGRCLNYRIDPNDPYRVKTLRCLEREGHDSKCRFPEPTPKFDQAISHVHSFDLPKPEPWVVPE